MKQISEEEALRRIASQCSTTEHCESELCDKMRRWGVSADAIARIIEKMYKENFINEERFCRAFINDKFRFAKWGKIKIRQALYQKKIAPATVSEQLINNIPEEEYQTLLINLIATKKRSIGDKEMSEYELNGKLIRFAISRGFEMKDILKCLNVEEQDYN